LFTEAKRFTNEQRELIVKIKLLLGEEALQHIILVFSHCNKKQTEQPEYFRESCWNEPIKAFVNSVDNRWAISPNPDTFPPDNTVHQKCLQDLQNIITSMNKVYTTEIFERVQKIQEENARIAREAEEKRQREYDENLRREGEDIARKDYERQQAANENNNNFFNIIQKLFVRPTNPTNQVVSRNKSCFWLETQVKLESGRIIQMSELQIGDRVLSNIRNGIAEFSDVYLIAHIGKLDYKAKFANISFTRPDGSKGTLFLIIFIVNE
jgi:hypothetical protein